MLASIQHFTKLRRLWLVASKYFKIVSIFHLNEYFWISCLQTNYYPSKDETHWCVFQLYQDSNSRQLVGKAWKLPLSFFAIAPLKKWLVLSTNCLMWVFLEILLNPPSLFFWLLLFSLFRFHFDGFGVFNRVPWLRAHWLRLRDAKGIRRNWRKARWLVIRCR